MMLQTRGQVTAAEVASELEVSERTARRDLDALGVAGLPIYSTQGRNGGWRLAGDGRTDLSGLTSAEAQALFVLAGPRATTPEVRGALRKLLRALPEPLRDRAEAASVAIVHDDAAWGGTANDQPMPVHLDAVQAAVINATQIVLGYVARDRAVSSRVVHPLGLATKGNSWYLVAGTEAGQRTFRLDRMTSVEVTGDPVVRPEGFVLAESWQMITSVMEDARVPIRVRALVVPVVMSWLRHTFGTNLRIGAAVADGRVEVEVRGYSDRIVASELAGFGAMLEVLEPPSVRARLAVVASELIMMYGAPTGARVARNMTAHSPADDGDRICSPAAPSGDGDRTSAPAWRGAQ